MKLSPTSCDFITPEISKNLHYYLQLLVHRKTFKFSFLECVFRLYSMLATAKVKYMSAVWNSITSTDANKLERIQQKSATLGFNCFFPQVDCDYALALEQLKLHNLRKRGIILLHSSLLKFTVTLNSAFLFWKPLVFQFLLSMSETFPCSMSVLLKCVLLLDGLRLLKLFTEPQMYLE
jgi:hypothetical protein